MRLIGGLGWDLMVWEKRQPRVSMWMWNAVTRSTAQTQLVQKLCLQFVLTIITQRYWQILQLNAFFFMCVCSFSLFYSIHCSFPLQDHQVLKQPAIVKINEIPPGPVHLNIFSSTAGLCFGLNSEWTLMKWLFLFQPCPINIQEKAFFHLYMLFSNSLALNNEQAILYF